MSTTTTPAIPARDVELGQPQSESTVNEKTEAPTTTDRDVDEDGKEYPPWRKVIIVMVAVFLSLFIISLVCRSNLPVLYRKLIHSSGSNDNLNGHPSAN